MGEIVGRRVEREEDRMNKQLKLYCIMNSSSLVMSHDPPVISHDSPVISHDPPVMSHDSPGIHSWG